MGLNQPSAPPNCLLRITDKFHRLLFKALSFASISTLCSEVVDTRFYAKTKSASDATNESASSKVKLETSAFIVVSRDLRQQEIHSDDLFVIFT